MYKKVFKRFFDFILSFLALVILSPVLIFLTILGAVKMKGNPFYVQRRPGRIDKKTGKERIISLLKFRSMTNERDETGKLLPDRIRLTKYGRFLRATSLDELPSLINIWVGDISIVGPRPLAVIYLPYYTAQERRRHSVRPGLTGLAQVNGRNALSWESKFAYDIEYIDNITLWGDIKIIVKTVGKVFARTGIGQGEEVPISLHEERAHWKQTENGAVAPITTAE